MIALLRKLFNSVNIGTSVESKTMIPKRRFNEINDDGSIIFFRETVDYGDLRNLRRGDYVSVPSVFGNLLCSVRSNKEEERMHGDEFPDAPAYRIEVKYTGYILEGNVVKQKVALPKGRHYLRP